MAKRVALLPTLALALAAPAWAGLPPRAGVTDALLGRWDVAESRLGEVRSPDRVQRYFRGRALLELGRPAEALTVLGGLARSEGAYSGPALEAAVNFLFEAERYAEVTELLDGALADRFQDPNRLHYQAGQSHALLGRTDAARGHLAQVTAGPLLPYARYSLGLVNEADGRTQEAVVALGAAVDAASSISDPEVARLFADRARITRARVIYSVAAGGSAPTADRKKLYELALSQFNKVASTSPFYADALRGIGWCAAETGDPAKALAAFEAAAEADPALRYEDLWAQGRVHQRLGYFSEAAALYGEARRDATDRAESAAGGTDAKRPWQPLLRNLDSARDRLRRLGDATAFAAGAGARRAARLDAAESRVIELETAGRRLAEEVASLTGGLEAYLDAIPASALFPRSERPRLEGLNARQDRLLRETGALVDTFDALGLDRSWAAASPSAQARGAELEKRLEAARAALSKAQLAFLEGLKARVSTRSRELSASLAAQRTDSTSLAEPVAASRGKLAAERERLGRWEEAVRALEARRAALVAALDRLEQETRGAAETSGARFAEERRRKLRLRADALALDETEALHLWEQGRPSSGGAPR